jgi:drug/metabolite transporter (DMT)-like permease
MNTNRRHAVAALIAAGLLWGTTVPLSKLALEWLSPGWLTAVRFGLAAAVLLAAARRRGLRRAFTPAVLAAGALGYGGSVLLQNAGISRTSVTHAALLIGAVPVLVAIIAAVWHRTVARPVAWFGFAVSLGGVGLVTAGGGGGGTTLAGDGLVLASLVLSATVTVAQGRLLTGRDPVAVTAVLFLGAALGALPVAAVTEGIPAVPGGAGPVLAAVALAAGGTLLPFTLFAFGQSRVSAEVAGAFLNLEPLVGAIAGAVAFGDPVGFPQVTGGMAIVAGIGLSSLPLLTGRRTAPVQTACPPRITLHTRTQARPARPPLNPPRCRIAARGIHHIPRGCPRLPVRTLQSAEQLTTLVGKKLLLDPHKARPRASVRSGAVDHDGMAEDHVPRLARQFDHAKGHAFDDGFPIHESGDPVGRRRRLSRERHEPRVGAVEPLPGLGGRIATLVRGNPAFPLDEQTG